MCTVSVVPVGRGCRIVCNRDERRDRPAAERPAPCRVRDVDALWPRDPASGGTWIGINRWDLAAVLLNRNPAGDRRDVMQARSRGSIVPSLLRCARLDDAIEAARLAARGAYQPFTLLLVQEGRLVSIRNHRRRATIRVHSLMWPIVFTSSSLGDRVVQRVRRRLFATLVERSPAPLDGQRAFHRHRWPARPEISVCMSRGDAATVSRTVIDLHAGNSRLRYTPIQP
jgi:uncharacterized protein with NRDE domain